MGPYKAKGVAIWIETRGTVKRDFLAARYGHVRAGVCGWRLIGHCVALDSRLSPINTVSRDKLLAIGRHSIS